MTSSDDEVTQLDAQLQKAKATEEQWITTEKVAAEVKRVTEEKAVVEARHVEEEWEEGRVGGVMEGNGHGEGVG